MQRIVLDKYGFDINKDNTRGFKFEVPGVSDDTIYRLIGYVIKNLSHEIKPYDEALVPLYGYYDKTKKPLYFVTARHRSNEKVTRTWLNKYIDVPFDVAVGVGCTHKAGHLIKRGYNAFVDDRYKTAIHLSERIDKVFLFNRPWNQGREVPNNVKRIDYLGELL